MKGQTWIVVANSSVARIFKAENNHTIVERDTLVHPESRMKTSDIVSDKAGRSYESARPGRHAVSDGSSIKDHEASIFAKEIAKELERAALSGELSKLYIAASPNFLGILRKEFNGNVEKVIKGEINKDVSMLPLDKIRDHLPLVL